MLLHAETIWTVDYSLRGDVSTQTKFYGDGAYEFLLTPNYVTVYEHHGNTWQLGALEWVFTSMPAKPPLPGARYGVFGAACHYRDGTVVFATALNRALPRATR